MSLLAVPAERSQSTPLLLIRADADTDVGTGHIMRTLAVAQAWRLTGGRVTFLVRDVPRPIAQRLLDERCDVVRWPDVTSGSAADAERVYQEARRSSAAAILVDGYAFGEPFRRQVCQSAAVTMLVHDYGVAECLWLDYLLNANPHAAADLYPFVEPRRQLLGLRWAMLRTEFLHGFPRRGRSSDAHNRVLVTLGGGDPDNVTERVVRSLDEVERALEVRVITGAANPHSDSIVAAAARSRHAISVLPAVADMPGMMAWADIAVAAAGSTSWELAWMGVPWISIALAENQRPINEELGVRGLAMSLGWHERVDNARIGNAVGTLVSDPRAAEGFSQRAAAAVDGEGAARIVAVLQGEG